MYGLHKVKNNKTLSKVISGICIRKKKAKKNNNIVQIVQHTKTRAPLTM